ncbi:hypothetical protein GCM10027192_08710 [Psychrobacter pocilloporae]
MPFPSLYNSDFDSHNDKDIHCEKCRYNVRPKRKHGPKTALEAGLCFLFFGIAM